MPSEIDTSTTGILNDSFASLAVDNNSTCALVGGTDFSSTRKEAAVIQTPLAGGPVTVLATYVFPSTADPEFSGPDGLTLSNGVL